MQITDTGGLITKIDGNTQFLEEKEVKDAIKLYLNNKSSLKENKLFCANYERDNVEKKPLLKVYLAIPYSGMEESSYEQATEATMLIINELGHNVFSPITHSHPIAKLGVKGTWDYWQKIDYQFIDWAEEVWVLVPEQGLTKCFLSTGVTAEMKYAEKHNKRIKLVTKKDNKIVEYGSC